MLYQAIDMFVPSVETRNNHARRGPSRIRALCARKRCAWNQIKSDPSNDALRVKYKELMCEYRTAVGDCECKWESEFINSRSVSSFYKYVNSRLHNSTASSVLMDSGSPVFSDDSKAEVFNAYFNSCLLYTSPSPRD